MCTGQQTYYCTFANKSSSNQEQRQYHIGKIQVTKKQGIDGGAILLKLYFSSYNHTDYCSGKHFCFKISSNVVTNTYMVIWTTKLLRWTIFHSVWSFNKWGFIFKAF